jgi:hypothetical protein
VPPKPTLPAKTPGPNGNKDQGDPNHTTFLGWTPSLTGVRDWADHTLHEIEDWAMHALGGFGIDKKTGAPMAVGPKPAAVEGDLDLSFLGEYVGGEGTPQAITNAATELKCDASLIYAIAKQESASSSFIKLDGRTVPAILYERHQFRK